MLMISGFCVERHSLFVRSFILSLFRASSWMVFPSDAENVAAAVGEHCSLFQIQTAYTRKPLPKQPSHVRRARFYTTYIHIYFSFVCWCVLFFLAISLFRPRSNALFVIKIGSL